MIKISWWLRGLTFFGLIFLYAPLIILVLYSFNASPLVNIWGGFSLKWYGALLSHEELLDAAKTSLLLGVSAASLSVVLGVLIAIAVKKYGKGPLISLLQGLSMMPIVLPDVVVGMALLLMFVGVKHVFGISLTGFFTILIAHVTLCTAYATVLIQSRLGHLDASIEEAALDLGASPAKAFFSVVLPQMRSAIVAAWLLSFTLSLDELVVTSFVSGPGTVTLPMFVFSSVKVGVTPMVNALAALIIVVVTVTLGGLAWFSQVRSQKVS
jgi:putrescine transport system permease protein